MAHPRRPRQPQRTLPSFLLALLFHAALFGALTLAVNWRTESEAPAVAELWGAVPPPPVEVAPAPPPPPPPPPKVEPEQREADIALKIEQGSQAAVAALHTTLEPKQTEWNGYTIALVSVSPSRNSATAVNPADYRAKLLVTR